jgi:hypothetical protein
MLKPLCFALLFVIASGAFAVQAQTEGSDTAGAAPQRRPTRLLNENYLTSTGETVPHPGASQGAPTTDLDRQIGRENDRLEQSICSNCD